MRKRRPCVAPASKPDLKKGDCKNAIHGLLPGQSRRARNPHGQSAEACRIPDLAQRQAALRRAVVGREGGHDRQPAGAGCRGPRRDGHVSRQRSLRQGGTVSISRRARRAQGLSEIGEAAMQYWLMKSEPSAYSWQQLNKDGKTAWTGVRNFQAAANLKAMKKGDRAFFYHSNEGLEIVGIMEITKEYHPDPTDKTEKFGMVEVKPVAPV